VVTKLDRLARSLPDARAIADELTTPAGQSQPGWVGLRSDRRGLTHDVQRPRHGGPVRVGPDAPPHSGGREGRQSPRVGCAASSPSSTAGRKPTLSPWWTAASTALSRSPSSSALADPRSTAPLMTLTPNCVSHPEAHPRGVRIHMDTKGALSRKMRDHMVQVIVEELERRGVSTQVEQG
jgi:hypothetical protein